MKLAARHHGPEAFPPILLLHELGGSGASFRWLLPELPGLRTIALDLPGSGESPAFEGGRGSLSDHADAVWSFLRDEVRTPVVIVGIAFGAVLGAIVAARHPEAVDGVVFCCMGTQIGEPTQAFLRERSARVAREGVPPVVDLSLARSYPQAIRTDAGRFAEYARDLAATRPEGYIRQSLALADAGTQIADALAAVRSPVAIVGGAHDGHFTTAVMRSVADRVHLLVDTVTLEGAAHLPHVQAPRDLAAVVRTVVARASAVAR